MALSASIKLIKTFPFKGGIHEFSNRYHFIGGTPPDATHWAQLAGTVVAAEKQIYSTDVAIVQVVGYGPGSDLPLYEELLNVPGTLANEAGVSHSPGECAALATFTTAARSTKNHPIYLFNYWHGVFTEDAAAGQDTLAPVQHTAMTTYASAWQTGSMNDGTTQYHRSSPRGAPATSVVVDQFVTHRDFRHTRSQ